MCKALFSLAFIALSIGLVHSWDVAITTEHQLEFYTNKTKTNNVGKQFKELTALAYDAVHNMLLFVDKQNDNGSIFSYHIATKKYQSLVRRSSFEDIQGLAFDPVTSTLFWTDKNQKSIFWFSLKPGFHNNSRYGNLLIKMDVEIPRAIAVDSCRGYIYWTNINVTNSCIERARFDGSDRKVIVNSDIFMPVAISVDQHTKKLYWLDDREGIHYSIESSDLDGQNRVTLLKETRHTPNAMTVSKDSIYWVDHGYIKIWKLPKNATNNVDPEEFATFGKSEAPFDIIANYNIQDQTEGVSECKNLRTLSQDTSIINDSLSLAPDDGLFCLHGIKVNGKLECACTSGYIGTRCDVSVCQNYCLKGDCSVTSDGQPTCRCQNGFSGARCEINVCEGFCLNHGTCSLDSNDKPVCSCATDYEGSRCEKEKVIATTTDLVPITAAPCNCTEKMSSSQHQNISTPSQQQNGSSSSGHLNTRTTDGEFVMPTSCNDGWDTVRDPIIMMLGILCGLLFLTCAVLITKILQLKKRPRIKKRIIVNKNVTPMTARPDQCEITIENCCNMNICETPCFEPRSTIRPTLLDAKPGKEEKKNLITNMEYPDEY